MEHKELSEIAKDLFFSIAVIKECNYKCGYCYPFGQNKSIGSNMSAEEFTSLVTAAYDSGYNKFKITGGEPTIVGWLFNKINELMDRYQDISFTVISNGKNLESYLNILEKYRDRTTIQFSLDSVLDKPKDGIYKVLNAETYSILRQLSEHGIKTRINMVVTSQNKMEITSMIKLASELGFSLKLFNLFIQDEYIATNGVNGVTGKYSNDTPSDYWKRNYVTSNEMLSLIKDDYMVTKAPAGEEEGFGSIQDSILVQGVKVIILNSSGGAFFNKEICIRSCPLFGKTCEKGLFNPLVSSNMVLHIDDCNNSSYRWDLRGKSHHEIVSSINEITSLFGNLEFVHKPLSIYQSKPT